MSDYKHGDWYCKPANEAEAKEIVERAIASGAVNPREWLFNSCSYGVHRGCVTALAFAHATKYTIDELRQKFPLPGEQVAGTADFMSGDRVEIDMRDFISERRETGETATVLSISVNSKGIPVAMIELDGRNGECDAVDVRTLRPLRTERERWVEAAARIPKPCGFALVPVLEQIYDAMQSGHLKAPTNEPG